MFFNFHFLQIQVPNTVDYTHTLECILYFSFNIMDSWKHHYWENTEIRNLYLSGNMLHTASVFHSFNVQAASSFVWNPAISGRRLLDSDTCLRIWSMIRVSQLHKSLTWTQNPIGSHLQCLNCQIFWKKALNWHLH